MVGCDAWENAGLYIPDTTTQPPKLNVAIVAGGLMVTMTYKLPHQPVYTVHHPLKQVHKQGKARRKLLKRYRVARYWSRRTDINTGLPLRWKWSGSKLAWPSFEAPRPKPNLWQRIGGWL